MGDDMAESLQTARPEQNPVDKPDTLRLRYGLGIGAMAFAMLQLQIILIKVSSFLFWHHFAYAIISLALLGLGIAGTRLTVRLGNTMPSLTLVTRHAFLFAVSIPMCFMIATRTGFRPLEIMNDPTQHLNLLLIYVALAIPFFFAGITLSAAMKRFSASANHLYAFDLTGAGLGCLLVFLLLRPLGAIGLLLVTALSGLAASYLLGDVGPRWKIARHLSLVILAGLLVAETGMSGELWSLTPSNAKDLQSIRSRFPDKIRLEYTQWDPVARIDITAPFEFDRPPEFSGVVSKHWENLRQEEVGIFQDAAAGTPLYRFNCNYEQELPFMRGTLSSAAFEFLRFPKVLVIGAGGCPDCHAALANNAGEVIAVEINTGIVNALESARYREFGSCFLDFPNFKLVNAEGRHYIRRFDTADLDIIQLSGVDTFAALASGAYSLAESYLYTIEAMKDFYSRLSPNGVVCINRWIFDPPRETLRLTTTMHKALTDMNIPDPENHLFILGDNHWANTMMKKQAFSEEECRLLRDFADRWQYRVIYDPYEPQSNRFNEYLRGDAKSKAEMIDGYPMRIAPCTDNAPFFFQWYRWSSIFTKPDTTGYGGYGITQFPIGNLIMVLTLLQITFLAALFILLPLRSTAVKKISRKTIFGLYFACLGTGFMFIEICLMQKLVLFLGHPSYSISISMFAMLIFAALGSAWSSRWAIRGSRIGAIITVLIAGVLLSMTIITWGLDPLLGASFPIRVLATILAIAPAAVMLGMPFPCAIRYLSATEGKTLIPWFWGVNGFFSVIGSVIAVLLAIMTGFNTVILVACGLYALAAIIGFRCFNTLRH